MNTDRATAILCLVISAGFYFGATEFPYLGRIFPQVIAVILSIMSIILLIKSFISPEMSDWYRKIDFKNVSLVAIGIIIYVIITPFLGIITSSTLYIILFGLLAAQKITIDTVILSIIVGLGVSGVFSYVFINYFYIRLPTGFIYNLFFM